ncbi:MAG TPA: hypothetical protein VHN74_16060 [Candidatus Angelobacter sp.]|jgi:hypothetical protein|nr:hypothetical protein [Candidatus Angelobacter sp.]
MDNFHAQSGSLHVQEGHEESDLNVRGIALFLAALAVSGVILALLCFGLFKFFEYRRHMDEPKMTITESQLFNQREAARETEGRTPLPEGQESVRPLPDWYGRGKMDEHLTRTFPGPRLQYDDVYDMSLFRDSEEAWLSSSGKDKNGNIHISVDQAKQLLVQRGLPQVPAAALQPNNLPTAVPMVPAGPSRK